jgi:hypothetical protein
VVIEDAQVALSDERQTSLSPLLSVNHDHPPSDTPDERTLSARR